MHFVAWPIEPFGVVKFAENHLWLYWKIIRQQFEDTG